MDSSALDVLDGRPVPPTRVVRPGSWLRSVTTAGVGAAALALAFPPHDWLGGWLAIPALAVMLAALRGVTPGRGALLGFWSGCVFFGILLGWMRVLGLDAWVLLTLECAVFWVPIGLLCPRLLAGRGALLSVPLLWLGVEQLRSMVPWGGFPWGRLAFSQSQTALGGWAVIGGVGLVSLLVAMAAVLLLDIWAQWSRPALMRRSARATVVALLGATLVGVGGAALIGAAASGPGPGGPIVGTAHVAVVQGNVPRAGLDFNAQRRAVLDQHVAATLELAKQVQDSKVPAPDAVIWPENSSDIDPMRNADAREQIDLAARAIGAPILVGAVLYNPADPDRLDSSGQKHLGSLLNAGIVWDPVTGPGQLYLKRHPVPFGEYLPMRGLLSRFVTRFDRIPRDFAKGQVPGMLDVGGVPTGVVICFEVAYDDLPRQTVLAGGQVLVVQTNNATYARSGQPEQQLAITRLRARELGRDTLVAATSGISAAITPAGTTTWEAPEMVAAAAVVTVPLRTGITPAVRFGAWLDRAAILGGLMAVFAWFGLGRRFRRRVGGFEAGIPVAQSQGERPDD